LGLKITGVVGCIFWGIFWTAMAFSNQHYEMNIITGFYAFLGILQGSIVFLGARQIEKLEGYQFAVVSGILAMLPCSPAFLIGLPTGICTLYLLRNPEVRAAFLGGQVPVASVPTPVLTPVSPRRKKGFFRRTFGTTTGWAMILCVMGCLSTFFVWADANRHDIPPPPGFLIYTPHNYVFDAHGYETVLGLLTATTFLILFLFLVATGFLEPIPIWRPASLFVAGLGAILFPVLGHHGDYSLREGAYIAIVLGVGLLLLGAMQVRGILMQGRSDKDAGPDA
jgi:hypothetical protein